MLQDVTTYSFRDRYGRFGNTARTTVSKIRHQVALATVRFFINLCDKMKGD